MRARNNRPTLILLALAGAAVLAASARAEAPHIYAITGARIVTAVGPAIESGTVVIRDGRIEAVGAGVSAPPGAAVVDGKGLTVYPGFIDMGRTSGIELPASQPPANPQTRMELERWKRNQILRPQVEAAEYLRPDAPEFARLLAAGITSMLAVPPGDVVRGQSSLVNLAAAEDAPQIGNIADERRGLYVVKSPVALHVAFPARPRGDGYPVSLMGVIGFVRQAFFDASHYRLALNRYERAPHAAPRPVHDRALEALAASFAARQPVALEAASAVEIRRALNLAKEFDLVPIVTGAREADEVVDDLKAAKAPVVVTLDFPVRPRTLAPDADETLETLRARANAPKVPAALEKAGVLFAFESGGLREPSDFVRNAAKAVSAGLSPEAAIKAMTINAAVIAGASDRVGSVEKGKIANLLLVEGDIFGERMRIRQVFVDGRPVAIEEANARPGGRGGRGQD
ncbi:MAG: amidohydrolase family protein [Vicinamibacterales bacterium]